ncbi:MAG: lysine exporter LysO family protein [Tissierellia bacterium]|nr:lysine exporter LysO family protein [Tissierellia bacterium]
MSLRILLAVGAGMGLGYFFLPASINTSMDLIIDIGLMLLLFFVGMDIGKHKDVLDKLKKLGFKVLLVPLVIIVGSVLGGMVAGPFIGLPYNEAGAIGSGLGWYTLSSMMLTTYSTELSALAFLSNVIREILALITIPLIAKYIGFFEAIAPAAATAMDTCLPVISSSTDSETTIVAFITGVICTMAVPIILPIIINL